MYETILGRTDVTPKLLDSFTFNNEPFLVIELLNGTSLREAWNRERNYLFVWITLYHVLICIRDFHRAGFIHSDVHAENIVWTGTGVKLIDLTRAGLKDDIYVPSLYSRDEFISHSMCDDILTIIELANCLTKISRSNWTRDKYASKIIQLYQYTSNNKCGESPDVDKYTEDLIQEYSRIDSL